MGTESGAFSSRVSQGLRDTGDRGYFEYKSKMSHQAMWGSTLDIPAMFGGLARQGCRLCLAGCVYCSTAVRRRVCG
jgi:hypothetical protein